MNDTNYSLQGYRYFVDITTRWMDNDIYGHVNNVTYYSYFDTAANHFLVHEGGLDMHADDVVGFVVASNCEYKRPIAYPDKLRIGFRVNRLGARSVEYGLAVFRETETTAVACGTFTHVFVSRKQGGSVAIPDRIRSALATVMTDDSKPDPQA